MERGDAWSWPEGAGAPAAAPPPQSADRRQPRLWPSAVLADVPGWGGSYDAQDASQLAVGHWVQQPLTEAAPAACDVQPDMDEQLLAEQMLLRSMQSIGLSVPHDDNRTVVSGYRREPSGAAGGRAETYHRSDADSRRQRQLAVRRTVFVRDIDQEVSEEQVLHVFTGCGTIVDSRMCGDPNSALRFAFIEFDGEEAVSKALGLSGAVMGSYSIKVVRSKTAIVPVNASLLPRTEEEHERCKRTVYVTNIDLGVESAEVCSFFETLCGPVMRLHLTKLDNQDTQVAFVEFSSAQSADRALSCGGARLKALPIRVSPSKTPLQLSDRVSVLHEAAGFVRRVKGRDGAPPSGFSERGSRRARDDAAGRYQRQLAVRRTVFIRDIDQEVSEEQVLHVFTGCGTIVDSRMCGDPNSALRFAFIEFDGEEAISKALGLSGAVMGSYSIKVVRSKTAIVPVNASLLPRTEEEHERCKRTVYVTNIDLAAESAEVCSFFETLCGPVMRLHLTKLDNQDAQVAFVEFVASASAERALSCGGARIRALPIRVSPSKTPLQLPDRDFHSFESAHRSDPADYSPSNGCGDRNRRLRVEGGRHQQHNVSVRRTVFIRDIDQEVSEEQVLHVFTGCGTIVDSRMCGDPNSALRFAFIEFDGEEAVSKALGLSGAVMGSYSIKVVRSKTAIVPVNASLLPRTEEEHERCKRTVYVTNIDLGVESAEVCSFFETLCGPVMRLHLTKLDNQDTQVAFVEFSSAQSADRALSCGGARLKALPIRVSPSKTPLQTVRKESGGTFEGGRGRRRRSRFAQQEHAPVVADVAFVATAITGADSGQSAAC